MSVGRDRSARPRGVPAFAGLARLAGLAGLAGALVLLGAVVSGPSAGQALIIAVTVGALVTLLATVGRIAVRAAPVVVSPGARAGDVDAPSAYWCALQAPTCPRRPRAPGRS